MKYLAFLCIMTALTGMAHSGDIKFALKDKQGNPVANAVVTLEPIDGQAIAAYSIQSPEMTQHQTMFDPFVLVASPDEAVRFLNKDDIRHHVYSFSKGNSFEIPLFGGDEEKNSIVRDGRRD